MVQSVELGDIDIRVHTASSMNQQVSSPEVDTNWESTRDRGYLVQYIMTLPPTPVLSTRPQSEQSPDAAWVRCLG